MKSTEGYICMYILTYTAVYFCPCVNCMCPTSPSSLYERAQKKAYLQRRDSSSEGQSMNISLLESELSITLFYTKTSLINPKSVH